MPSKNTIIIDAKYLVPGDVIVETVEYMGLNMESMDFTRGTRKIKYCVQKKYPNPDGSNTTVHELSKIKNNKPRGLFFRYYKDDTEVEVEFDPTLSTRNND